MLPNMSVFYFETSSSRLKQQSQPDENDTVDHSAKTNKSLPSCDQLANMFKAIHNNNNNNNNKISSPPSSQVAKSFSTTPKTPSNLVREQAATEHLTTLDKEHLVKVISEREASLLTASKAYLAHYDQFGELARKFYAEKLNNLRLAFRTQILKQQIYFETELFEICKECAQKSSSSSSSSTAANSVRFYKKEMKFLVEYMREALVNSSDTLIEAHETCGILRALQNAENSVDKQFLSLKTSTSALIKATSQSDDKKACKLIENEYDEDEEENCENQLDKDELQLEKYRREIDELMHTLDDIELQHLHRKDLLQSQAKFVAKLKAKFRFVESKYEVLSRRVANLKYESYLYKRLWYEKKRSTHSNSSNNKNVVKSSISPSNTNSAASSRTSSTSSLSDHDHVDDDDANESYDCGGGGGGSDEFSSHCCSSNELGGQVNCNDSGNCSGSVVCESLSLSLSLSAEAASEQIPVNAYKTEVVGGGVSSQSSIDTESDESSADENNQDTEEDCSDDLSEKSNFAASHSSHAVSLKDYNRKMTLLNELIHFHKAKALSKDFFYFRDKLVSFSCHHHHHQHHQQQQQQQRVNIDSVENEKMLKNNESKELKQQQQQWPGSSSIGLSEVSADGDRVGLENCDLRLDRDVSGWMIERQIEHVPSSAHRFEMPPGSVVRSGKVLCVKAPFSASACQLEFLAAIGKMKEAARRASSGSDRAMRIRIRTRLVTPDGLVKAVHTQQIPSFYEEIYRYASLIHFI